MLLLTQAWWTTFSYAQEAPTDERAPCSACTLTPDALVRYMNFMRAVLNTLQSTSKIDYSKIATGTKQANTNLLINYQKQQTDSYFWVFKREGRVIAGQIQGASLQTITAVSRDFLADFLRQSVAWVRSSALVRDEDKLEQIDESIDREAIVHINNYVYTDPIPTAQLDSLKNIFSVYSDIFTTGGNNQVLFSPWISYQQFIGWLNYTQRTVKNHIVVRAKTDFKYESNEKVGYSISPIRGKALDDAYACATANLGTACNASFGKASSLRKEFGKSAGKELKTTLNKFKTSFQKLSNLKSKGYFKGFGDSRGIQYRGSQVPNPAKQNPQETIQILEEDKQVVVAQLDDCIQQENSVQLDKLWNDSESLYSLQKMGLFPCKPRAPYLIKSAGNVTEPQEAKALGLTTTMNSTLSKIMDMEDSNEALSSIALPLTTTRYYPLLSQVVYTTKETVKELNANSVQWCLAFCTNLNSKVNCGSQ